MFPRKRHCGCMKPCHCQKPAKEIVYPVKENVIHKCTEETVKHIHPSHTTIVNQHLVKNEHLFPHTTSVENTYDEVDVMGAQTGPGMGPGGPGPSVMGTQTGWNGANGFGKKPCKKKDKWY